jgi:hypothetical protein
MADGDNADRAASGVQLDLISSERSKNMGTAQKINMILDRVAEGAVIILEEGLDPDEESKLIERTMTRTDGESFTGIEIDSYQRTDGRNGGLLGKLVRSDPSKLTVIGPANKVQTLDKDETLLRALVGDDED